MIITGNKFTPSVNIIRDEGRQLNYITTPNSQRVFSQIENDFSLGIHSFNIIGSYGTGKSSFLWAVEKQLAGESDFFSRAESDLSTGRNYKTVKLVGDYLPIRKLFASAFNVPEEGDDILNAILNLYNECEENGAGLFLVIDEFGKCLEYAAKHNPEHELYFIQQVAEAVNDTEKNILFALTLHQNFMAYTSTLDVAQRQEWEKVKGRFKEVTFNEPVEQLLHLAASYLEENNGNRHLSPTDEELIAAVTKSNVFPFDGVDLTSIAPKLYPLDIVAASILALSLQKYGQNERSLFTFLKSNDIQTIAIEKQGQEKFHIAHVYDYLLNNFYSFLATRFNPDYLQWADVRRGIDRAEPYFKEHFQSVALLIKTIGMLNMFASDGASIDEAFLESYATICLGIENSAEILRRLSEKKIIRYQYFNNRFVLFDGTDLDIDLEVKNAEKLIDRPGDITPKLLEYFHFPYLLATRAYFETGIPRFFTFRLSKEPSIELPMGEIDGIINLVFDESQTEESVRKLSHDHSGATLYGLHQKTAEVRDLLFEIDKVSYVLNQHYDDTVARNELVKLKQYLIDELNRYIMHSLYEPGHFIWIFHGNVIDIPSRKNLNTILSDICERVYLDAPVLLNELINRHKLSASVTSAKNILFERLLKNNHLDDLGFDKDKFPPEKNIYLCLIKNTGIHREIDKEFTLTEPLDPTFKAIWNVCESFLDSCKKGKRNLADLVSILSRKPIKLKQGFIDFWLPLFLFIKRDDYFLYFEHMFVPKLTSEVLQLLNKKPDKYFIKALDVDGVRLDLFAKYRRITNQASPNSSVTHSQVIETLNPFMAFLKGLPEYAQRTKRISAGAVSVRAAIANATEPEKLFFEDLPHALGYSLTALSESDEVLEEFVEKLQLGLRELRTCFDSLLGRFESFLLECLNLDSEDFDLYRKKINDRYRNIKEHLVLDNQRVFLSRIQSKIDERSVWLQSLIAGLIGKPAHQISDSGEAALFEHLKQILAQLDNLREFSRIKADPKSEEIVKINLYSSANGQQEKTVLCPVISDKEKLELKNSLKTRLTEDSKTNIIILLELLKDHLDNE